MFIIRCRENGDIIDHSLYEGDAHLKRIMYENDDRVDGSFSTNFYEVVEYKTYIYDKRMREYLDLCEYIPGEKNTYIFKEVRNSEIKYKLSEDEILDYYGGAEFLRRWKKNHAN